MEALHLAQHTPMHGRQRKEVLPGTPDSSPEQPSPKQGAVRQRENDTPRKYKAGKFRAVLDEVHPKLADGTSDQGRPKGDSKGCTKSMKEKGSRKKNPKATRSKGKSRSGANTMHAGTPKRPKQPEAATADSGQTKVDDFYPTVSPTESGGSN